MSKSQQKRMAFAGLKPITSAEAERERVTLAECIRQIQIGEAKLAKALKYFQHKDGCSMREWSDPADHVRTWFRFMVTSDECTCGAIAVALELDPIAAKEALSDTTAGTPE